MLLCSNPIIVTQVMIMKPVCYMGSDVQTSTIIKQVRMIKPHHRYTVCGAPTINATQVMVLGQNIATQQLWCFINHHYYTGEYDQTSMLHGF